MAENNDEIELWHPRIVLTPIKEADLDKGSIGDSSHMSQNLFSKGLRKQNFQSFLQIDDSSLNTPEKDVLNRAREKEDGQLLLNSPKLNCACKFIKEPGIDSVTGIKLANLPRFSEVVNKRESSGESNEVHERSSQLHYQPDSSAFLLKAILYENKPRTIKF